MEENYLKKTNLNSKKYYERHKYFYELSLNFNDYFIPQIYNFNENYVFIEKISNFVSLYDLIKNNKINSQLFYDVGKALAKFHKSQENNLSKKINVHGDFWANNVLIQGNKIYFIDFDLPHNSLFEESFYIKNYFYFDLVKFVFKIKYYFNFSNLKYYFFKKQRYIRQFIKGYINEIEIEINSHEFHKFMCYFIEEEVNILQNDKSFRGCLLKLILKNARKKYRNN